ncbi:MAG: hypothetical protein IPG64_25500 [Haliea sp.]|nr:hypothetical protein [Haliea sp.]
MNPLALNVELPQRMRTQPQIAIGLLPIGLMFASFAPLFFLAVLLSSILGIPEDAPVKDQANGMLWLVLFLFCNGYPNDHWLFAWVGFKCNRITRFF